MNSMLEYASFEFEDCVIILRLFQATNILMILFTYSLSILQDIDV